MESNKNYLGDCPSGIYSQKQIDYVNSIKEEDLRTTFLHILRSRDNGWREAKCFENKCNTLENIILDIKEMYPDIKVPTIKETADKHGELESYLKIINKNAK